MVDSNPVDQSNLLEPPICEDLPPTQTLDGMIQESMGNFRWPQFQQTIAVSLALLFDAQQAFICIYSDADPTWHCTSDPCTSSSDICKLSRSTWAWDQPAYITIISDWNLECATSFITGLPTSSFFMGCLIGGFTLAALADSSLGRKKLLFLSCLTMSIAALVSIISTNVWVYSAIRFLSGFGRAPVMTCALVLLTEMVRKEWRGRITIIGFFFYASGFLSLPAIAYLNRASSWRLLYIWTSVPAILYCLLGYFFVVESPRWLFTKGREQEAITILTRSAPTNLQYSSFTINLSLNQTMLESSQPYSSMKKLFERRWSIRRILAVIILAFGIGMMYIGMPLGVGNLGFNIYLSVAFNALIEIPTYFISLYLLENWYRRNSIMWFCMASGICSIACGIAGKIGVEAIEMGLELASFFSACTAFNVLLVYVLELFPTSVRNSATSLARQAIFVGAMLSPLLISIGRKNVLLCYGVFGLVIMCCGLVVACLPETKNVTLCDTMDEEEEREEGLV